MYRTSRNLILLSAVFFSLIINKPILAEDIATEGTKGNVLERRVNPGPINQGGLVFDIQKMDPSLLAEKIEKLRATFIRRQHELKQLVTSKKLNAGDALITIIMPGGLLYAGYRKQELEQAKTALLVVTEEIKELSNDLIIFQGQDTVHPLMLAQLP